MLDPKSNEGATAGDWVFTYAPLTGGGVRCLFTSPIIHYGATVRPDHIAVALTRFLREYDK